MPESSDLLLMTDRVGKGWFSMLCHGSELIGSSITYFDGSFLPEDRSRARRYAVARVLWQPFNAAAQSQCIRVIYKHARQLQAGQEHPSYRHHLFVVL
jgi:hypothetical protein